MNFEFKHENGLYIVSKIVEPEIDLSDIDALQEPVSDKLVLDNDITAIIQQIYNGKSFSLQDAVQIVRHCLGSRGYVVEKAYELLVEVRIFGKPYELEWKDFWEVQSGKYDRIHGTGKAKLMKLNEPGAEENYLATTFKYNPDILIHGW